MFSFFKKNPSPRSRASRALVVRPPPPPHPAAAPDWRASRARARDRGRRTREKIVDDAPEGGPVQDLEHLSVLFVGAKIDDALYDELEAALLMSDAGVDATEFLLTAQEKGQGRQAARRRRRQGRAESAADRTACCRWKSASSWAATSRW
jgi:fused signal recognition particle receptor